METEDLKPDVLIETCRSLIQKIDERDQRIADLKAQVAELRRQIQELAGK